MKTFEEFRATRQFTDQLDVVTGVELGGASGYTYIDGAGNRFLFIEQLPEGHDHKFNLCIGNQDYFSDDLEELEPILYQWAADEEVI